MTKNPTHLEYDDFQAIVQRARMQRSVAVGDAIAGLISATLLAFGRVFNGMKSAASGAKSTGGSTTGFDAPAHR